ncbi:MAG TPA: hypothetical protein PLD10_11345 [Rhodopila sp.]|nr:hypothetical protein [Rhodopila sp.]
MMSLNVERLVLTAGAVMLLSGCGSSAQHQSARVLQHRLQANLAPELDRHQVTLQRLPNGAQVVLDQANLFAPDQSDLTASGRFTVASLTESLLDPSLMRVTVIGAAATPAYLRQAREQSVRDYVRAHVLGPSLDIGAPPAQPVATQPVANAAAQAVTVTILVQCPPGPQGTTWGYPNRGATCN